MRQLIMALLILMCGGCGAIGGYDRAAVVYNGCGGSWIRVKDGTDRVLADRIDFGHDARIILNGYAGNTIYLLAEGYEIGTNRPLGSATSYAQIYRYRSDMFGVDQIPSWQVTFLYANGVNTGCRNN